MSGIKLFGDDAIDVSAYFVDVGDVADEVGGPDRRRGGKAVTFARIDKTLGACGDHVRGRRVDEQCGTAAATLDEVVDELFDA